MTEKKLRLQGMKSKNDTVNVNSNSLLSSSIPGA